MLELFEPIEIGPFKDEYEFLSNFYPSPIRFRHPRTGIELYAPTVEHAYQACKTMHISEIEYVLAAETPGKAKLRGRQVSLVSDWEDVKVGTMYSLVLMKFKSSNELEYNLIKTGDAILIEKNWWHDNQFGACVCDKCKNKTKHNYLGKILMLVRDKLVFDYNTSMKLMTNFGEKEC